MSPQRTNGEEPDFGILVNALKTLKKFAQDTADMVLYNSEFIRKMSANAIREVSNELERNKDELNFELTRQRLKGREKSSRSLRIHHIGLRQAVTGLWLEIVAPSKTHQMMEEYLQRKRGVRERLSRGEKSKK